MGEREEGDIAAAVINILAFLGWNPGTEQELFSKEELIEAFSLERVNKSGARFDFEKTKWFNQQYIKNKSNEELVDLSASLFEAEGYQTDRATLLEISELTK